MASYRKSRFVPIFLIVLVVGLIIIALIPAARNSLFSDTNTGPSKIDIAKSALTNTAADRSVAMTVRGKITADENFRSYQIKISPNERVLTVYQGYMDNQVDNITLDNNIPAYEQFVYALNRARLMDNSEFTGTSNDTRGICASGYLYEFQLLKANKSVKKLWTTSCNRIRGSLGASPTQYSGLFIDQIPGAQAKIGKLWR